MNSADRELLQEIADRSRRTETRVTKVANHLGVDAGGEKPRFFQDRVYVPSRRTALEDIIAAVPVAAQHVLKGIEVFCDEDYLMTVSWLR